MATIEELRRGIGTTNEANRRNIGKNNEAQRRQIGRDMIERRTGVKQVDDINALVKQPRQQRTMRRQEPRGGLSGAVGTGTYTPPATGTGGGIASPLTETPDTRTFHESIIRPSVDGAVFFQVRAAKTVTMTDANGAAVIMEFANVTT